MRVSVFFHRFQGERSTNGETLGIGIPLGANSVLANFGDEAFPAFIQGEAIGKWRVATELEREFASSDLETRARRWMSGSQLVAVSGFQHQVVEPCFIGSDEHCHSKRAYLQITIQDACLQKMAGIQSHFLSLHLCEMLFPEMGMGDSTGELQKLDGLSIATGDTLPILLLKSHVVGVLVVELVESERIFGTFHYIGDTLESGSDDRAVMRFTSEFMGTTIDVANELGDIVVTAGQGS